MKYLESFNGQKFDEINYVQFMNYFKNCNFYTIYRMELEELLTNINLKYTHLTGAIYKKRYHPNFEPWPARWSEIKPDDYGLENMFRGDKWELTGRLRMRLVNSIHFCLEKALPEENRWSDLHNRAIASRLLTHEFWAHKIDDDYFLVRHQHKDRSKYYKCDEIDGVLQMIKKVTNDIL